MYPIVSSDVINLHSNLFKIICKVKIIVIYDKKTFHMDLDDLSKHFYLKN